MCQDLLSTPRNKSPQSPQPKDPVRFPIANWVFEATRSRMLVGACLPRDVSQILQVMFLSMQDYANISRSQTAVFPSHSQLYRRTSKDRSWSRRGWRGEGKVLRIGSSRIQSHAANKCLERRTPQRSGKMRGKGILFPSSVLELCMDKWRAIPAQDLSNNQKNPVVCPCEEP